jgi:hypothetical protein
MKPYLHSRISAKKFGGIPEDYIEIHDWFDSTKGHIPDARHRLVLHNAYGIFLCEQVFGEIVQMPDGKFKRAPYITISTGKKVSVRDIAEQHVLDDLGHIPTLAESMNQTGLSEEFSGNVKRMAITLGPNTAYKIVD